MRTDTYFFSIYHDAEDGGEEIENAVHTFLSNLRQVGDVYNVTLTVARENGDHDQTQFD